MRTRTTILVVDDSRDFQTLMTAYLAAQDYVVLTAADTLQATGSALRDKPSLVIVDIGLPGGDGWMLLDRLKANTRTRHIPVVVVTAQSTPGLPEKASAKGAAAFLHKPLDKNTLLATIDGVLSQSSSGASIVKA